MPTIWYASALPTRQRVFPAELAALIGPAQLEPGRCASSISFLETHAASANSDPPACRRAAHASHYALRDDEILRTRDFKCLL